MADNLLCQGLGAAAIRDELAVLFPDNLWFVSVQPASGSWATGANTWHENSESHFVSNSCGKNLYVFAYSGPAPEECSPNTGDMAQKLVDDAVELALGTLPSYIRDYVTMRKTCKIEHICKQMDFFRSWSTDRLHVRSLYSRDRLGTYLVQ